VQFCFWFSILWWHRSSARQVGDVQLEPNPGNELEKQNMRDAGMYEAPPRFELGFLDSKSKVVTTGLWGQNPRRFGHPFDALRDEEIKYDLQSFVLSRACSLRRW
jgi:hypothetical protein